MAAKIYGIVLLLTLLTVGMLVVRSKARVENNWLPLYWGLMIAASLRIEDSWDHRMILGGFVTALMMRFEFVSQGFETLLRVIEVTFFLYVLYRSYLILVG